ncbi:MAG: cation diffusion facilitator CzcD-associated flavoprotein CzcO [Gammaproteobacteria bacterium]
MSTTQVPSEQLSEDLDAVIIGAGVTGLYQLHRLRELGFNAQIFEGGAGVGGTWYWNRYPGARFDSESYTYGYEFSEELLQEWEWKEHFSGQPENERYLNFVADKFNLKPHIRFNTLVTGAKFDPHENSWQVHTADGQTVNTRFVIAAVGILSASHLPDISGIDSFQGESFHTSRWPHEPIDFTNKRVGVIGTGATAVQLIPELAKQVGHLTVFQRSPNWCLPLRNSEIDAETQKNIKATYPEIFQKCRETFAGFIHDADPRSALEVTPEVREAYYEEIWAQPGFAKWHANFYDIASNLEANETYAEFIRKKIRARISDPMIADLLIPKDHPFGSKRVPLETGYYETYNKEHVQLVDVRKNPIERITPTGLATSESNYELDIIIYATGFDAITGELTRMDIRGLEGRSIEQSWSAGPETYLTMQTAGFPNFFIANGAVFCNVPRCAEIVVEWVSDCMEYMRAKGHSRIEATSYAQAKWTEEANSFTKGFLFSETDAHSWFMGTNIPGKARNFSLYAGGAPTFREKCTQVAENGYQGFVFS